ncbi:hypothetical protein [Sulfitobacter sp. 1A15106]|uniref:hypothetical protein n=1 Tax=Sulfitobacter sp. 1A15106 TaxID=3368590 RepID=UPI0037450448
MATNTAFGPQGYNSATSLPPGITNNRAGWGVDTWVVDCTPGDQNGTILDAAFFNMILGSLRNLVRQAVADGAPITITDGDMNMVLQAVKFYGSIDSLVVGSGLKKTGNKIEIDVATLKTMTA